MASVELYSKGIWRLCREEDGAWDVHTGLLGRESEMRSTHQAECPVLCQHWQFLKSEEICSFIEAIFL